MAVDGVFCEPVSALIPCYLGKIQGNSRFWVPNLGCIDSMMQRTKEFSAIRSVSAS